MIVARVRRTLLERRLVQRGTRVLVGCSGGPDSAALLFSLARLAPELELTVVAASVDHGLRAGAALDVEIAAEQAADAGVPFHALRVQVASDAASLQAEARRARYAALSELAARCAATRIAVGHTADDQAETVLMRMLRGAGIAGLGAAFPLRADGVIRPLIDCRRADALQYARARCRRIALDPSNQDPRFERVRVRGEILPLLERQDASVVQHLCDVADEARELSEELSLAADALLARSDQAPGTIDVSGWTEAPDGVRSWALRRWLERECTEPVGREQLRAARRALAAAAEVWLPGGRVLRSDGRGGLTLSGPCTQPGRGPKPR